jgi:hypothetical protein
VLRAQGNKPRFKPGQGIHPDRRETSEERPRNEKVEWRYLTGFAGSLHGSWKALSSKYGRASKPKTTTKLCPVRDKVWLSRRQGWHSCQPVRRTSRSVSHELQASNRRPGGRRHRRTRMSALQGRFNFRIDIRGAIRKL